MFETTAPENFESWDRFLGCYFEPIRTALRLMPFVGEDRADDVAQSFFLKMYERDILENRPAITGRFRNWLYAAARRHAIDEWRKIQRRPERPDAFDAREPAEPRLASADDSPFDADELYALSLLHLTVARVRQHLIAEGKREHWLIFEELVLAPLVPGRAVKTRDELAAMFPGRAADFLDNRVTTVKRVFRRILPALIPADPTESISSDERFHELLEILRASKKNRLWLAFLTDPAPGLEESTGSSLDLAARPSVDDAQEAMVHSDILRDELRVLLAFWLEMPMHDYLDDIENVGPAVASAVRGSRPAVRLGRRRDAGSVFSLKSLIDANDPCVAAIPAAEMTILLERLKVFAKRVHRLLKRVDKSAQTRGTTCRDTSMPAEVAQVLYDLAGALALARHGVRIIGLSDERFRKNLAWALNQSWLDIKIRPVFAAALRQLGPRGTSEAQK
jgi:DNA-directed RNA polymerase specialized sigma24 family protein